MKESGAEKELANRGEAANGMQILHDVGAAGLEIRKKRCLIADSLKIVNRKRHIDRSCYGNQMKHGVGGAAERADDRHGVLKSFAGHNVAWLQIDEKNLVTGTVQHKEAPIPPCVTDLMSAIFYGGSQPLPPGQSFHMPLADAMRVVDVTIKAEAREQVVTPAGTFQTIRVQPTADAGVVKNRGNIWIWYTEDARHIPVQMRARLFWGTITLRLTSVEPK